MINKVSIDESRKLIENIISSKIITDNTTIKKMLDLLRAYPGNKWAALLVIAPFIDGSEEPLREATRSMLMFDCEYKNKSSAFSRNIEPLESSYHRMKWFYNLKLSSSISRMVIYALQEVEMSIRERKNIALEESSKMKAKYYTHYKENLDKAINEGYIDEAKIIEDLYSLQTPSEGFWVL